MLFSKIVALTGPGTTGTNEAGQGMQGVKGQAALGRNVSQSEHRLSAARENITLDEKAIQHNPGLRQLSKLMHNSFWGRFGMRENLPQCTILRQRDELLSLATSPHVDLLKVVPINEEAVYACWNMHEDSLKTESCHEYSHRILYNENFLRYYLDQTGSGVGSVYRGVNYQKGSGIGSFLGGLFRSVLHLFKSGARAIGKEALKMGSRAIGKEALKMGSSILGDMMNGQEPVKTILRRRALEAGENLKTRAENKIMQFSGAGYKPKKTVRKGQSLGRNRGGKTHVNSAKKRKLSPKDIFG
ncbi:hypothetical protein J437_LFUL008032 [Ladona fulva]|uniref:DNA-directed DNA polymerase n=1 Tax=Ladona fulva TaxID=123851 RepID=A0A8K0P5H1_LADFU|nr:hypothetical protein J437_LFUL008032 [Ladona fulva]